MTTVLVTQPCWWAPTWWHARALAADVVVLLDTAQFARKHRTPSGTTPSWQNCCEVKTANGVARLTVPVRAGRRPIACTPVADPDVLARHLRTLDAAYRRAPHWDETRALYIELCDVDDTRRAFGLSLGDLTVPISMRVLQLLGHRDVRVASSIDTGDATGSAWMLALAQAVGATRYLAGQTALATYLDRGAFDAAGVELVPHRYVDEPYPQRHGPFIGGLSILDLLGNVGASEAASRLGR